MSRVSTQCSAGIGWFRGRARVGAGSGKYGTVLAGHRVRMANPQTATGPRLTALVVEDDPAMRSLLRQALEREGFDVLEDATALAALGRVEQARVDVAIVDKEMPGMSGLDLVSSLADRCPGLPVILVTAFGGAAVAEEAFRRGAARYLEKPFRIDDLMTALRTMPALERRSPAH